jgi:polyisoprenyl-teichoic acid--peptidoglycan teichoic acid transferase
MRRSAFRTVLAVLTVGLLVGAVALVGYTLWLRNEFESSRHTIADAFPDSRPPRSTGAAADAQNILLIGTDSTRAESGRDGKGDTMVVAHVDATRKHVTLLAIPRHALLEVPGHGRATAHSALAEGGVPLAVRTVERLVGVRMDHVAAISFPGLVGLTDALDGVSVANPTAFHSPYWSTAFPAGTVRLSGPAALAYVRGSGVGTAAGDALRIRTQRAYLTGALGRLLSPATLLNPVRTGDAVRRFSPYLSTDAGLDANYVVGLGFVLRDAKANGIGFLALPVGGTTTVAGESALVVPATAIERIRTAFGADTVAELAGGGVRGVQRP